MYPRSRIKKRKATKRTCHQQLISKRETIRKKPTCESHQLHAKMSWRPASVTHRSHGVSRAGRWLLLASVLSFFAWTISCKTAFRLALDCRSPRHSLPSWLPCPRCQYRCTYSLQDGAPIFGSQWESNTSILLRFAVFVSTLAGTLTSGRDFVAFAGRACCACEVEAFCALFDVSGLLLSVSVPPAADEVDSAILGRLKGYLALFGGCTGAGPCLSWLLFFSKRLVFLGSSSVEG